MGVHTWGKWGQLTLLEKWMKNSKAKTCKKEQFLPRDAMHPR